MGQDLLSSYGWGNKHPPSSILGYLGTRLLTHNHITISSLDWWGINFYLSLYSYKSYYLSVISIESLYRYIYIHMAVCQILVPLVNIKIAGKWMFIPLKMVLIGIDPYPYIYDIWYTDHGFDISMFHPEEPTKWTSLFPNISPNLSPHHSLGTEHFFRWICLLRHGIQESTNLVFKDLKREILCSIF